MPAEKPTHQHLSQKALERKSTKPIMEKRRRARINSSLNELKNLILDALKKDNARNSKLEKADILEMTVKYLKDLQRQQRSGVPPVGSANVGHLANFTTGYSDCAAEVGRFMTRYVDATVEPSLRHRLQSHLNTCLTGLSQIPTTGRYPPVNIEVPSQPGSTNGLHLVPTRLSTGELAFLVPNSSQFHCQASPRDRHTPLKNSSSPINVLGSSGILSPAASDRSCSPTSYSLNQTFYEPISPVPSKQEPLDLNMRSGLVNCKQLTGGPLADHWRPW